MQPGNAPQQAHSACSGCVRRAPFDRRRRNRRSSGDPLSVQSGQSGHSRCPRHNKRPSSPVGGRGPRGRARGATTIRPGRRICMHAQAGALLGLGHAIRTVRNRRAVSGASRSRLMTGWRIRMVRHRVFAGRLRGVTRGAPAAALAAGAPLSARRRSLRSVPFFADAVLLCPCFAASGRTRRHIRAETSIPRRPSERNAFHRALGAGGVTGYPLALAAPGGQAAALRPDIDMKAPMASSTTPMMPM